MEILTDWTIVNVYIELASFMQLFNQRLQVLKVSRLYSIIFLYYYSFGSLLFTCSDNLKVCHQGETVAICEFMNTKYGNNIILLFVVNWHVFYHTYI